MPHIPGHVKGGPSSFGILTPLYRFNHKTESGIEINLPIGFAPSADIFNLPTADLTVYDDVVGFLPYITPWPSGIKKYLVTAAQVIPFDLHEKSHKVIDEFKKVPMLKTMDKLQKLFDGAKTLSEKIVFHVAANTIEYKASSIFNTIYRDSKTGIERTEDQVIEWIALNCVGAEVMGLTSYKSLHGGNCCCCCCCNDNHEKATAVVKKKKG